MRFDRGMIVKIPMKKAPDKRLQLAARLRVLADQMVDLGVDLDYFGGMASWASAGRQMIYSGEDARALADKIEAEVAEVAA